MTRSPSVPLQASSATRRWPFNVEHLKFIYFLSDLSAVLLASIVAGYIYHWLVIGEEGSINRFIASGVLFAVLVLPSLALREFSSVYAVGYAVGRSQARNTAKVGLPALVLLFVAGTMLALGVYPSVPHGQVLLLVSFALGLMLIQRRVISRCISRGLAISRLKRRSVLLIRSGEGEPVLPRPDYSSSEFCVTKIEFFPSVSTCIGGEATWEEFAQQIVDYVREAETEVDEIHISLDWGQWIRLKAVLDIFRLSPVPVFLLADENTGEILQYSRVMVGSNPAFQVKRWPLTSAECLQKRAFDLSIATICLAIALPLFALVALAIRLDSRGPIWFQQSRKGLNGKIFKIYKFRTMTVLEDGPSITQAIRDDPRVTRVGRWLRRTSLDELPQLLNVIKGEMSLVGPRPHAVAHDIQFDKMISTYTIRSQVKPGITGWAQIHDMRGATPSIDAIRKRTELDIYYVNNQSIFFDVQILAKTAVYVLSQHNAY
jgi:exopolysaccharide biosynthesis polyprenyl glycosylphosphotransferase